ncbi:MAG: hypothetical protein DRH76_11155, partial [Deltaproteobacteria bacterium]
KVVSAILTGDWHLRDNTPICRGEDFEAAQWAKVDFISKLQRKHGCLVIHAGDLFDHWKPSPYLLSKTMEYLPSQFHTIYGNHDLPQHNFEERHRCGIYALEKAGVLKVLSGTHWGDLPDSSNIDIPYNRTELRCILVYHVMTYQGRTPWPGCTDPMAAKLLRKYPEYDLIHTGHNHKAFTETHEGRLLVNAGSLTRQDADQINFKPRVYLYYADDNTVEPVYLPIQEDAVTRAHIERDEEREQRIEAFITQLDGDWVAGMSFEANLEAFLQTNKIRKTVQEKIYKALET